MPWYTRWPTVLKYAGWVPVAVAFNDLVASVAVVRGASMAPTLNPSLAPGVELARDRSIVGKFF